MKKIKYLVFVLFSFFCFNLNVNAFTSYYNFDTTFNVESLFDYSTLLNNTTCGNETYYQFIIDFINQLDLEHSRYYLFITTTHYNNSANTRKGYFHIYAIPKTVLNNQKRLGVSFARNDSATTGYLFPYNSIDIQQTTQYLDLYLPYLNSIHFDNCSGRYNSLFELNAVSTFISYFNDLPWQPSITISEQYVSNVYFYTSQSNFGWLNFNQSAQIPGVSNTNKNYLYSNNIDLPIYQLPFYSSYPLVLDNVPNYPFDSGQFVFMKQIKLPDSDTIYRPGSPFPTYYDLVMNPTSDTFIDYKTSLGTVYSNFLPTQLNSFDLSLSFENSTITPNLYYNNLSYTYNCYGRVNHSDNYFTYEMFPYCDFESSLNGSGNKSVIDYTNLQIYDSNDNVITDFSRYDKLFFYIAFQYKDDTLDKTVSKLHLNGSGNIYYSDFFRGPIYDNFNNLSNYFKLLVSTTKSDFSYFNIKYSGSNSDDRYFIYRQQYNLSNLQPFGSVGFVGKEDFSRFSVNNSTGYGYMFYHQLSTQNSGLNINSLDLIIFPDIVISIQDYSSTNLYYVDSTGSVVNNDFDIQYVVPDESYNIGYYVSKIDNFLEEFENDFYSIGDITQDFYDSCPIIIQNSILVLFILFCLYFVYKLIREK